MKFLKTLFFVLLLVIPVFDYIYKWEEGGLSPALILRGVAAVIMLLVLIPQLFSPGKCNAVVKTIAILLLYMSIITLVFKPEISSLFSIIKILFPFLGFIFIYYLTKNSSLSEKQFSKFYLLLIVILAITAYLNLDNRIGSDRGLTVADNTGYALVCAYAGVMLFTEKKYFPFVWFIIIVGTLICGKRGAIVALAIATLPLLLSLFFGRQVKIGRRVVLILLILIGSILAFHFFSEYFDASFSRFDNVERETESGRGWLYMFYWEHFADSDLIHQIFGHGLFAGTFGSGKPFAFTKAAAHNDWLELLFDFGIVGTILYALLILQLFTILIKNYRKKNKYYHMLLMSFIIWIVKSLVSSTFLMDVNSIYLYMTTAYAISKLEINNNSGYFSKALNQINE